MDHTAQKERLKRLKRNTSKRSDFLPNDVSWTEEDMIEIICSYCGKNMGTKEGKGTEGISHGVCVDCFDSVKATCIQGGAAFRAAFPKRRASRQVSV